MRRRVSSTPASPPTCAPVVSRLTSSGAPTRCRCSRTPTSPCWRPGRCPSSPPCRPSTAHPSSGAPGCSTSSSSPTVGCKPAPTSWTRPHVSGLRGQGRRARPCLRRLGVRRARLLLTDAGHGLLPGPACQRREAGREHPRRRHAGRPGDLLRGDHARLGGPRRDEEGIARRDGVAAAGRHRALQPDSPDQRVEARGSGEGVPGVRAQHRRSATHRGDWLAADRPGRRRSPEAGRCAGGRPTGRRCSATRSSCWPSTGRCSCNDLDGGGRASDQTRPRGRRGGVRRSALLVVPMAFLVRGALEGGPDGVRAALGASEVRRALWHTVTLAMVVTVGALSLGTALALVFDRAMLRRPSHLADRPGGSPGRAPVLPDPQLDAGLRPRRTPRPAARASRSRCSTARPASPLLLTAEAVPLVWLIVDGRARGPPRTRPGPRGPGQWSRTAADLRHHRPAPATGAAARRRCRRLRRGGERLRRPAGAGIHTGLPDVGNPGLPAAVPLRAPEAFARLCSVALVMVVLVLVAIGGADRGLGRVGAGFASSGPGGARPHTAPPPARGS